MKNITVGKIKKFYEQKLAKYNNYNGESFLEIMSYDYNRKFGENIRNNYDFDEQLNGLMLANTLNKIKEIDLKRKIKEISRSNTQDFVLEKNSMKRCSWTKKDSRKPSIHSFMSASRSNLTEKPS